jgi:hypothetical protein
VITILVDHNLEGQALLLRGLLEIILDLERYAAVGRLFIP